MSVRVMSWVWEHSRAEGTDRLVLLAIADSAGDDGGNAFPSIETLADKAKVSTRTVQRSIRSLTLLGEVSVTPNAGRHGTNVYQVRMDRQPVTPVNLAPVPDSHPGQSVTGDERVTEGVTPVTPGGDTGVTRTVLEPSTTRPKNISSDAPRPDVDRLCDHLADRIEANGSKRPTIGKRWRDAARLMLDADGRTEQQVHNAIDWCQADEFWRGNVLSMPKLRDKYDQLRLAAARATGRASPAASKRDDVERTLQRMENLG